MNEEWRRFPGAEEGDSKSDIRSLCYLGYPRAVLTISGRRNGKVPLCVGKRVNFDYRGDIQMLILQVWRRKLEVPRIYGVERESGAAKAMHI